MPLRARAKQLVRRRRRVSLARGRTSRALVDALFEHAPVSPRRPRRATRRRGSGDRRPPAHDGARGRPHFAPWWRRVPRAPHFASPSAPGSASTQPTPGTAANFSHTPTSRCTAANARGQAKRLSSPPRRSDNTAPNTNLHERLRVRTCNPRPLGLQVAGLAGRRASLRFWSRPSSRAAQMNIERAIRTPSAELTTSTMPKAVMSGIVPEGREIERLISPLVRCRLWSPRRRAPASLRGIGRRYALLVEERPAPFDDQLEEWWRRRSSRCQRSSVRRCRMWPSLSRTSPRRVSPCLGCTRVFR